MRWSKKYEQPIFYEHLEQLYAWYKNGKASGNIKNQSFLSFSREIIRDIADKAQSITVIGRSGSYIFNKGDL